MEIHESAENYLETILILKNRFNMVRSIDIANELNYTKPSVSIAMKKLRENEYIIMDDKGYISLTESGLSIAEKIYERHQVLSKYLMAIGVSKTTAIEDACRIEHVISDESFYRLKSYIHENSILSNPK
ncbi:metal-dependent transcriptional regulator [Clostridium tyrobutyricum]|jgi:Mn-dependent transcriptional regulator|uniref:metal-dependent transcriptional regulator n=1 Tax=Clostridium tyrobutyricum TaxID=1519 RepID=UPI00057CD226|nr:metal-dependent transcriptional regulator [Clostridium tyrobutyricum]